jgi:hypothetical protein
VTQTPPFYEAERAQPGGPGAAVICCIEHGSGAILFDHGALSAPFFDLSTGVAGELAQKLHNYGLRMAAVVPDPSVHSARFQDFAREANRGRQIRFFATRREAVAWLEAEAGGGT